MRDRLLALLFLVAFVGACTSKGYSRDEFKDRVLGKTMTAVMNAVGKPDELTQTDSGDIYYYHRRTYDVRKGPDQPDFRAQVLFKEGIATVIRFEVRSGNVDQTITHLF
jgi:hypothetical protein